MTLTFKVTELTDVSNKQEIFIILAKHMQISLRSLSPIITRKKRVFYRPCSSRRKIREKRREDALLATSNIARLVTKSTGNITAPK